MSERKPTVDELGRRCSVLWLAVASCLLTAVPLWAQIEILQAFPFEGPPGTQVPNVPPVTQCTGSPDFAPAFGSTAVPFTGDAYVGFHENLHNNTFGEAFSIEIDRTLESGTSYVYRFMARIAPIDPAVSIPWTNNEGGAHSGSFDLWVGGAPCAQAQLLGTINLEWPIDDAWTEQALQFVATADHQFFTYVGFGGLPTPTTDTTYFGLDDVTEPVPGITIDKVGDGPDPLQVGDTIDYTFLVTNSGNVFLSNIAVTDPLPGLSPIDCPGDTLAPGEEMTCTADYTVTQEDVDNGFVENTGTVTADPPFGDSVEDEDGSVVPPSQKPGISIEKSASGPDPLEVGATVDYEFLVTNTGNVTLSDITVTDPLDGLSPIDCPESTLAPGAEMTCTASYTVTQEDVDAGVIENTATATGQPPGGLPPPTDDGTTMFPPDQNPGISIEKSGSGPDPLEVGATIDYTFLVANTGNITLNNVTVTDPLPGLSPISCPDTTLAPGAEMTCTATYVVTQEDVDAGVVENTATVSGETPTGGPPPTDTSTTTVPPAAGTPGISMEKSGSGPDPLTVGATVNYEFLVTNTGNVTLTNVTVTDPLPGLSPISCPETTLAPGAEMTCTATYTVTQADAEAGVIENTATVTGETPTGGPPPTDTSTTTVPPAPPVPALPPLAIVLLLALLATATLWTLRRAHA